MYYELWDRAQARRVGRYFALEDAQNAARAYLAAAEAISVKFTLELLEMERRFKGRTLAACEELEAMLRPPAEAEAESAEPAPGRSSQPLAGEVS